MNPRLVMRLFAAVLVGFAAAAGVISAGWHPLAAIPVYSLAGSFALVAISLLAVPRPVMLPEPRPVGPVVGPETAPA